MKQLSFLFLNALLLLLQSCTQLKYNESYPMNEWVVVSGTAENSKKILADNEVLSINQGTDMQFSGAALPDQLRNFHFKSEVKCAKGASAMVVFQVNEAGEGYQVSLHNGPSDGTIKSGSLLNVRNIFKSFANDEEWFPLEVKVLGNNISVWVNKKQVVSYNEPTQPFRLSQQSAQLLRSGDIRIVGMTSAPTEFRNMKIAALLADSVSAQIAIDEQNNSLIRLQQQGFPLIDYHVHLKGWSKEQAHTNSLRTGINYGIAPNCGIGFPITNDEAVFAYRDSTCQMPFFFAMQGEGREWSTTFSAKARAQFDYVFTDALTFTDHKGRRTRLWIPEESFVDIPKEQYMDVIVDRTIMVLENEPIDIYVNPTFLPDVLNPYYDELWTNERMQRVIDVLKTRNIALEINARYRIPSFDFIRLAKENGIKFAFGTNNGDPNIGALEYCIEAIDSCKLTKEDIWFSGR